MLNTIDWRLKLQLIFSTIDLPENTSDWHWALSIGALQRRLGNNTSDWCLPLTIDHFSMATETFYHLRFVANTNDWGFTLAICIFGTDGYPYSTACFECMKRWPLMKALGDRFLALFGIHIISYLKLTRAVKTRDTNVTNTWLCNPVSTPKSFVPRLPGNDGGIQNGDSRKASTGMHTWRTY